MNTTFALFVLLFTVATSFVRNSVPKQPHTIHYYDYFKKNKDGEKKDVGRLWKNIIFPGIYVEYADTKEPIKTVKIETESTTVDKARSNARNGFGSFFNQGPQTGTYNVADEASVPQFVSSSQIKQAALPSVKKPFNFVAPTPKKAITIQLGTGISVLPDIKKYKRAQKPIILYEYESNGDCRKVREACTMLDLTVEFRPCPGALYGFSDQMSFATLGKREVPYMIDNNPGMYKPQLFGANSIVEYLFQTYGPGVEAIPATLKGAGKSGGGGNRMKKNSRPDNMKMKPVTLYGWEGAQYVKPVREILNELSLAHVFVNCANGSLNRAKLSAKTGGVFQVPYLVDPNTGVEMFESAEIVKYLEATYTVK